MRRLQPRFVTLALTRIASVTAILNASSTCFEGGDFLRGEVFLLEVHVELLGWHLQQIFRPEFRQRGQTVVCTSFPGRSRRGGCRLWCDAACVVVDGFARTTTAVVTAMIVQLNRFCVVAWGGRRGWTVHRGIVAVRRVVRLVAFDEFEALRTHANHRPAAGKIGGVD